MIRQIISNSIKNVHKEKANSYITLFIKNDKINGNIKLVIRDNGIGVKPYDLPFLFDKGFTGDAIEERKKSTGMGLYLAKQVADSLKIKMEVSEEYKHGFEVSIVFPIVG